MEGDRWKTYSRESQRVLTVVSSLFAKLFPYFPTKRKGRMQEERGDSNEEACRSSRSLGVVVISRR